MRFHKDQVYCFRLYNGQLEPNWKVLLSNDEIIYQDDYDGGSWADLQVYCKEKQVWPIHMTIELYDNVVNILPPNAEGYFYRKGILTEFMCAANPTDGMPFQGNRAKTVIIGYYSNELLYTTTIRVPELQIWDSEVRDYDRMKKDGILKDKSLILRRNLWPTIPVNIQTEKLRLLNT